eukprot:420766-Pyramimonas_sp.AAC.1
MLLSDRSGKPPSLPPPKCVSHLTDQGLPVKRFQRSGGLFYGFETRFGLLVQAFGGGRDPQNGSAENTSPRVGLPFQCGKSVDRALCHQCDVFRPSWKLATQGQVFRESWDLIVFMFRS